MAKLFVSYSRRDSAAARTLIEAFKSIEQDVWVDWESIPPAVDWLEQIFRGIEESDAFIFMISPDSIASEVCKVEINRAAQNNKRMIPIVLRDVPAKDAPENIRKLNWTYIREGDNFEEGLAKVKTAIELDLDWLEEHRRLQVRSLEWHRRKDPSLLLHGRDLRNARHMIATATAKDPTPTELQQKFIQYSLEGERNRTIAWIATAVAVVALTVLSFLAIQGRDEARTQRDRAQAAQAEEAIQRQVAQTAQAEEAEQRRIAETAKAAEEEQRQIAETNEIHAEAQRSASLAQIYQGRPGELFTSTLLAIDSMRRNLSIESKQRNLSVDARQRNPSKEAEEILRRNIRLLPLPVAQFSQAGKINDLAFSRDRTVFVTGSASGSVCAWRVGEDIGRIFCTAADLPAIHAVAINSAGTLIATGDQAGMVQILDAVSGEVLHRYVRVESEGLIVRLIDTENETMPPGQTALGIGVRRLSFHPGHSQQLAVAYEDGEIPVFNFNTGAVSAPLSTTGRPQVMGFSRNGTWLVAGSESGTVSIWALGGGDRPSNIVHRGGVFALAFSTKDNVVFTGGNDNAARVDLELKKERFRIANQTLIRDLAVSPDGSRFATASADRRIRIWNASTGMEQLSMAQDGSVTEVVFSSSGRWLATTGEDRTARIWDAFTGAEIFQIPLKASGAQLLFVNDDRWLVSTDGTGAVNVWDLSIMDLPLRSLSTPSNSVVDHVEYSPEGERLAVASEKSFWILPSNAEALPLSVQNTPFESSIRKLVFDPQSSRVGVLTEGNEIGIFDITRRDWKVLPADHPVQTLAFSPDGLQLVTSDPDGNIAIWEVQQAQWVDSPDQQFAPVFSMASSSRFIALGSSDEIHIAGSDGNGSIPSIEVPGKDALLVLSPEGSRLAVVDPLGVMTIWQYENNRFSHAASFNKERTVAVAFHPGDTLLAVGTPKHAYLIDPKGRELARIPHTDTVNDVSFSADGKYLATGSSSTLHIWDLAEIQMVRSEPGALIAAACSRMFESLSQAQWDAFFGPESYVALCESLGQAP